MEFSMTPTLLFKLSGEIMLFLFWILFIFSYIYTWIILKKFNKSDIITFVFLSVTTLLWWYNFGL